MDVQLAGFLISLALTALLCFPLAGALRKRPGVFYAIAIVLTVAYVLATQVGTRLAPIHALTVVLQKGYLSILLLAVVMFTGCLNEGSALRKRLQPIRGELSVLSGIFIVGHVLKYLPNYLGRFWVLLTTRTSVGASLIIALTLTVLFAVLAVTSLRTVRKHMSGKAWKRLQRFSYLMVGLLAVHVALVLGRSALGGSATAIVSFTAYMATIAAYVVLRVRKARRDAVHRVPAREGAVC